MEGHLVVDKKPSTAVANSIMELTLKTMLEDLVIWEVDWGGRPGRRFSKLEVELTWKSKLPWGD